MFRNRLLKILALLMVLNILIIPLTSFTPQYQNKYKVYAAEGIVDIRFFNAVISMIGITAAGLATMSPSFSIPEADMVQLKEQFAQSLEADTTKKAAWMTAQTEYLAGGVAKTMGAVELAKIGINDVYIGFKEYINNNTIENLNDLTSNVTIETTAGDFILQQKMEMITKYQYFINPGTWDYIKPVNSGYPYNFTYSSGAAGNQFKNIYSFIIKNGVNTVASVSCYEYFNKFQVDMHTTSSDRNVKYLLYQHLLRYGIDITNQVPTWLSNNISGTIQNNNIINTTDTAISLIPTIPYIDTSVPIGTVVTPAIALPYAGAVPIDVPLTVPIDPPIEEPVDPPVEPTLIGTVAAILAGLTPIAGFLEYILSGQVSLTDTIEAGITGVIDGIGDIAGTLTGGITSSLTDIQSSISTLFDPPTETLNLEKLKNLNSVLFTKFPFSIPFDFVSMISAFSSDPVAPVITIPFDMSDFGGEFTEVKMDLSDYNNIAAVARQIGFIGFVFFMLFNTRKLIWK